MTSVSLTEELGRRVATAAQATAHELVRTASFRWSEHLLYRVRGGAGDGGEILVKRTRSRDRKGRRQAGDLDSRERTVAEYAALKQIERILPRWSRTTMIAIHPVACFPDLHAFAMEYCPGVSVLRIIRSAVSRFPGAEGAHATEAARGAGEWLATVHEALVALGQGMRRSGCEYVCGTTPDVAALNGGMGEAARIEQTRRFVADRFRDTTIDVIPIHGDFYPDNVVLSSTGPLYAVDTTLRARGPAEADVARFLVGVDTIRPRIIWGDLWIRRALMRDVKAAFLDGYRSVRELSSDLLLTEIASAYLVRWSELRSATRERPPALSSFARRRINAFMASRIAQFLDHPSELATN